MNDLKPFSKKTSFIIWAIFVPAALVLLVLLPKRFFENSQKMSEFNGQEVTVDWQASTAPNAHIIAVVRQLPRLQNWDRDALTISDASAMDPDNAYVDAQALRLLCLKAFHEERSDELIKMVVKDKQAAALAIETFEKMLTKKRYES